jgi:hypothetical protein
MKNKIAPNIPIMVSKELSIVREEDLPTIIQEQVEKLNELDKSTQKALDNAERAVGSAKNASREPLETHFFGYVSSPSLFSGFLTQKSL